MKNKDQRRKAEVLWAKNKYLVLSKSHAYYLKIRNYLKRDDANILGVEKFIAEAIALDESKKDVINAYHHIWGYFKDQAGEENKEKFLALLNDYKNDRIQKGIILAFLKELLEKYPNDYLENSTIFKQNP
mgnify:FL=1